VLAERAVLSAVGASCASAIGALAVLDGSTLMLDADASGLAGEYVSDRSSVALPDIALVDAVPGAAQDAVLATGLGTEAGRRLLDAGADAFLVR
jgi:porphobilinogen deaminase